MQDRILEVLARTAKDWNLAAPEAGFFMEETCKPTITPLICGVQPIF